MSERGVAVCPACSELVSLAEPYVGLQFECSNCEELLTVVTLDPLTVTYALDADDSGFYTDPDEVNT